MADALGVLQDDPKMPHGSPAITGRTHSQLRVRSTYVCDVCLTQLWEAQASIAKRGFMKMMNSNITKGGRDWTNSVRHSRTLEADGLMLSTGAVNSRIRTNNAAFVPEGGQHVTHEARASRMFSNFSVGPLRTRSGILSG